MHNYDPIYIKIYPSSHKQKTPRMWGYINIYISVLF